MVHAKAVLLTLLVASIIGCAAKQVETVDHREWVLRGEDGDFVVAAILTDDFEALLAEWQSSDRPNLESVPVGRLGGTMNIAFLVSGCAPKKNGACDVATDITITNEKGAKVTSATIEDTCPGQADGPASGFLLCAYSPQLVNRGKPQLFGVHAVVRDKVAKRKVALEMEVAFADRKLPPRRMKP